MLVLWPAWWACLYFACACQSTSWCNNSHWKNLSVETNSCHLFPRLLTKQTPSGCLYLYPSSPPTICCVHSNQAITFIIKLQPPVTQETESKRSRAVPFRYIWPKTRFWFWFHVRKILMTQDSVSGLESQVPIQIFPELEARIFWGAIKWGLKFNQFLSQWFSEPLSHSKSPRVVGDSHISFQSLLMNKFYKISAVYSLGLFNGLLVIILEDCFN